MQAGSMVFSGQGKYLFQWVFFTVLAYFKRRVPLLTLLGEHIGVAVYEHRVILPQVGYHLEKHPMVWEFLGRGEIFHLGGVYCFDEENREHH